MSGAVPLLAARPLGRAARVPRPVCPGCSWCGRGDPAPAPRRAPLRAGVARRGGGGRASPGEVPFAVVRSVWAQALPLPRLPALWAGCRGPLPTCCWRGCADCGPRAPPGAARHGGGGGRLDSGAPSSLLPALWAGCRGPLAWVQVLMCAVCVVPVRCVSWCWVLPFACPSGAPLSGALLRCVAPRVLAVPPSLRASLARLLATSHFFRGFVVLYPFLCPPLARPPPWHALFPRLRPGVCLGLSPCLLPWPPFWGPLLSLLLGPVRQWEDWGLWAY